MTYRDLFEKGRNNLSMLPEGATDAFLLFEYVTGFDRLKLLLEGKEACPEEIAKRYEEALQKRLSDIPIQYITGFAYFYKRRFRVTPEVLIPRFDTEILIDVVKELNVGGRLLDMCTGSGIIAITLCLEGGFELVSACDISSGALSVAKENAKELGASVTFSEGDLFENVVGSFDLIVSNPPYIRTMEVERLEASVKDKEPRLALDGGADGLDIYRRIIAECPEHLNDGGALAFEIGFDQASDVCLLLEAAGFGDIKVTKDLAGHDRVITARYRR